MHLVEIALEDTDEIHDRIRPGNRARDGVGPGQVGGDELRLAKAALRAQVQCLARIALRDADAGTRLEQFLHDIAADKTAAAEQRHQLVLHRVRLVLPVCRPHAAPAAKRQGRAKKRKTSC